MVESEQIIEALDARVRRREERRAFFRAAAIGAAAVGTGAFLVADPAKAQGVTDIDVLNFALNLEYLEANFYSFAVNGTAIDATLTTGPTGTTPGAATGGRKVNFIDPLVAQYAKEIAADELAHVKFLRGTNVLSVAAVAQPAIDLGTSATGAFSNAARAAGVITGASDTFDPYASDENFLLAAYIFEDVGVTAYKGAAPLVSNPTFREAAAGILAVEAYHAAIVRTTLYRKGINTPSLGLIEATTKISDARDTLDGNQTLNPVTGAAPDDDQGIAPTTVAGQTVSNIAPLNENGLAYSRDAARVLNIVYLNKASVTMGGFFPAGVNGTIKTSAAN